MTLISQEQGKLISSVVFFLTIVFLSSGAPLLFSSCLRFKGILYTVHINVKQLVFIFEKDVMQICGRKDYKG